MLIYKICTKPLWDEMQRTRAFIGMPIDARDGYIHFSTAEQNPETARKYFAGQADLMLLTVDTDALGDGLKWEPSRGGDLFPHFYGKLPFSSIIQAVPFAAN